MRCSRPRKVRQNVEWIGPVLPEAANVGALWGYKARLAAVQPSGYENVAAKMHFASLDLRLMAWRLHFDLTANTAYAKARRPVQHRRRPRLAPERLGRQR